jgi:hypothetical protein
MSKYQYIYQNNELQIIIPPNVIFMALDENDSVHLELISLLKNIINLELYVDYLGDNPNRAFDINEIKSILIN